MSILTEIGTSAETFAAATGAAATAAFEALPSGAYKAKVKSVMVYTNQFGGTQMKYIVTLDDGEKDIEFRQDISAKLKPDETTRIAADNLGYASRLKQFCHATNVDIDTLSLSATTVKIRIFGKETDAKEIQGMTGKTVLALVRQTDDVNKADGESYKVTNDLEGVCAVDGTDASGENAQAVFLAKIEKAPVFKIKGKVKAGGSDAGTPALSNAQKEAAASLI